MYKILNHTYNKSNYLQGLVCKIWPPVASFWLLVLAAGFGPQDCDGDCSVRSSGIRCTPVSRRWDRWSFLVSSALFPWWKHSTLHTAHCGHEMLKVVHLKFHTLNHIHNHVPPGGQVCTVRSLGH